MIRSLYRWFLARFRLNLDLVCELSQGKGLVDFHDYPDSTVPEPLHFYTHTCARCGKRFTI